MQGSSSQQDDEQGKSFMSSRPTDIYPRSHVARNSVRLVLIYVALNVWKCSEPSFQCKPVCYPSRKRYSTTQNARSVVADGSVNWKDAYPDDDHRVQIYAALVARKL